MKDEVNTQRKEMMILQEKRRILACEAEIAHYAHMTGKANEAIADSRKRIAAIESGKMP